MAGRPTRPTPTPDAHAETKDTRRRGRPSTEDAIDEDFVEDDTVDRAADLEDEDTVDEETVDEDTHPRRPAFSGSGKVGKKWTTRRST